MLAMERGSAWIRTPESVVFSGTVLRTIETATYTAQIPSGAEVYLTETTIEVYAADGVGSPSLGAISMKNSSRRRSALH